MTLRLMLLGLAWTTCHGAFVDRLPAQDPAPADAPESAADPSEEAAAQPAEEASREAAVPERDPVEEPAGATAPGEDAIGVGTTDGTGDGRLQFSFQEQPWEDVIEWFVDQSDLALMMDEPPPGTFNYTDPRRYTPTEALDLLNGVLIIKGYTLIRRGEMLFVVNLEDGVPPTMVEQVPLEDLDERGEHDLVRVIFPLSRLSPDEAATEVERLIRNTGVIVRLERSKRIEVVETAGRLRVIRDVLDAIENPHRHNRKLVPIELEHRLADEILPVVRQMLQMPEDAFALEDGTLQLAVDIDGTRLIARGERTRIEELQEVINLLDVPGAAGTSTLTETPQVYAYPIAGATPESALKVLQTLLAGDPDIRIDTDPETGNLYAFVRPSQHQRIEETLNLMQRDLRQIDVIPLSSVDPQVAVLAINRLFGGDAEKPAKTAPRVDADLTTRSLIVKGNAAQLLQIRDLLEKLGENMDVDNMRASRGNLRVLPLAGRDAQSALSQMEEIWPQLRMNRIRVVTPSSLGIPTIRPSEGGPLSPEPFGPPDGPFTPPPRRPAEEPAEPRDDRAGRPRSASVRSRGAFRLASDPRPGAELSAPRSSSPVRFASGQTQSGGQPAASAGDETNASPRESAREGAVVELESKPGSPIIVSPGPGGVVLYSEDIEALDQFEELLTTLASGGGTSRDFAVYYLRSAKASTVAGTLTEIFGGGSGASGGGGSGLLGDIAGAALGDVGGDLVGGLLGLGGGGGSSVGALDIVPDDRLNALVVRGKAKDLDTLEQLLKILDQPNSPEDVQVDSRPRLIQVFNTSAQYVQAIVQQVYQDRMKSGAGEGRQPSPEDIIRALRGGGGRDGGGSKQDQEEALKMTIGIDTRSNSLVVRAPDPLFEEVEELVHMIDNAQSATKSRTEIVSLKQSNSEAVQKALTAMYGDAIESSSSATSSSSGGASSGGSPPGAPDAGRQVDAARQMQRQIEMFQRMQQNRRSQGDGGGRGGRRGGGRNQGGGGRGGSNDTPNRGGGRR